MSNAEQILFFDKNYADYSNTNVIVTASEASAYAPNVQKRSNNIGWMTTGSVDANDTTLTIDFVDSVTLTDLILVLHNFASFHIQYWNGSSYVDFPTPINVTGVTPNAGTLTVSRFTFASTTTTQIQLTVFGTQVANSDKKLSQFIATSLIGQLEGWPVIANPEFNLNKRINTMLSGKTNIGTNVGGFNFDLSVSIWSSDYDLSIVELLYGNGEGFLVWLCGGSQAQFSSVRQGYRLQDFYLMRPQDNYKPEWAMGLYKSGMKISVSLVEVSS